MHRITMDLPTEADTAALAARVAHICNGTETILISGPVGAGKSALARAIIRALTSPKEDIPSPTFTLVQIYESPDFDIWHADLYRLSHIREIDELGLFDAFGCALCLVEWPDRLGGSAPADALSINLKLKPRGEGRIADLSSEAPHWDPVFEHADVR